MSDSNISVSVSTPQQLEREDGTSYTEIFEWELSIDQHQGVHHIVMRDNEEGEDITLHLSDPGHFLFAAQQWVTSQEGRNWIPVGQEGHEAQIAEFEAWLEAQLGETMSGHRLVFGETDRGRAVVVLPHTDRDGDGDVDIFDYPAPLNPFLRDDGVFTAPDDVDEHELSSVPDDPQQAVDELFSQAGLVNPFAAASAITHEQLRALDEQAGFDFSAQALDSGVLEFDGEGNVRVANPVTPEEKRTFALGVLQVRGYTTLQQAFLAVDAMFEADGLTPPDPGLREELLRALEGETGFDFQSRGLELGVLEIDADGKVRGVVPSTPAEQASYQEAVRQLNEEYGEYLVGLSERLANQGYDGIDIMAVLYIVMAESVREVMEDERYWLGKIREATEIKNAIAQIIQDHWLPASQALGAAAANQDEEFPEELTIGVRVLDFDLDTVGPDGQAIISSPRDVNGTVLELTDGAQSLSYGTYNPLTGEPIGIAPDDERTSVWYVEFDDAGNRLVPAHVYKEMDRIGLSDTLKQGNSWLETVNTQLDLFNSQFQNSNSTRQTMLQLLLSFLRYHKQGKDGVIRNIL